jgi:hypothetical protein
VDGGDKVCGSWYSGFIESRCGSRMSSEAIFDGEQIKAFM